MKLLRTYTLFIIAFVALVNGVLFICGYRGLLLNFLNELTGNSIIVNLYIFANARRMKRWYLVANYFILFMHLSNILYLMGCISFSNAVYMGIVFNLAVILLYCFNRVGGVLKRLFC